MLQHILIFWYLALGIPVGVRSTELSKKMQSYLVNFKKDLAVRGIQVDYSYLRFREDSVSYLGPSDLASTNYLQNNCGTRSFITFSSNSTETTMYHELGHALFHLDHSGNSKDLMYYSEAGQIINIDTLNSFVKQIKNQTEETCKGDK